LAIEARAEDTHVHELLAPLQHQDTAILAAAERAFLARLEGGCQVPMACHARLVHDADPSRGVQVHVHGLVVDPSGAPLFDARKFGPASEASELGRGLAETLLRLGAGGIIETQKRLAAAGS
jgi:hydroxymethylbilane synthase